MKHFKSYYSLLLCIILSTVRLHSQIVTAEISFGELIDKITILTIKSERITDDEKLKNVHIELKSLQETCSTFIGSDEEIIQLQTLLQNINEELWDIEDAIRIKERNQAFDDEFIALARSVYITNDKRCSVKKKIDALLGSHITEEKSYAKLNHDQ
jgi:hypothetical protein